MAEQKARTRHGVELLVEEWCHDGRLPFAHHSKGNVIITSGERYGWGFDQFIRTSAPNDLKQLGPGRVKNALRDAWGTKHTDQRVLGKLICGVEFPTLSVTRAAFEKRHNGGQKMDWRSSATEWEGFDHELPF